MSRALARAAVGVSASAVVAPPIVPSAGYLKRSVLPLHSLVFLLPLLALYEVGARLGSSEPKAFRLLELFFQIFGARGEWLPAMTVVGILLSWHIARRDSWKISVPTLG